MARVVVVGSINQDITVRTERFPVAGETLLGDSVAYGLGGKGANQAAAAARAGAEVAFAGATGPDPAGREVLAALASFGVETGAVLQAAEPTGTAHITVDHAGQNTIVVVPGANSALSAKAVRRLRGTFAGAGAVIVQCEIPLEAVAETLWVAGHEMGIPVLLNLAPAAPLKTGLLELASVLVVNETEAASVLRTGPPRDQPGALAMAGQLTGYCRQVVLSLGAAGAAVAVAGGEPFMVPAPTPAAVVDTTGAGDAMAGVLGAAIAAGRPLPDAVAAAVRAGTASVEREGAARSYPRFVIG